MTHIDPDLNPRPIGAPPTYTETVRTTVVRESNTGWWIAGVLAGVVLIAVLWILFARSAQPLPADTAALDAQADLAAAQAQADAAVAQGQIAGARADVEIARINAARAQADADRSASEARAAEARALTPPAPAVVTTTTPQPAPSDTMAPPTN